MIFKKIRGFKFLILNFNMTDKEELRKKLEELKNALVCYKDP